MTEVERLKKAIERMLKTAQPRNAGWYISSDTYEILQQAVEDV